MIMDSASSHCGSYRPRNGPARVTVAGLPRATMTGPMMLLPSWREPKYRQPRMTGTTEYLMGAPIGRNTGAHQAARKHGRTGLCVRYIVTWLMYHFLQKVGSSITQASKAIGFSCPTDSSHNATGRWGFRVRQHLPDCFPYIILCNGGRRLWKVLYLSQSRYSRFCSSKNPTPPGT